MNDTRYRELKRMLEDRRRNILDDVRNKVRGAREEASTLSRAGAGDLSDVEADEDLEFALIQIHARFAESIANALARLENGEYGTCHECGAEIPDKRLRAQPFAIRCKDCQESFEIAERRSRHLDERTRLVEGWAAR